MILEILTWIIILWCIILMISALTLLTIKKSLEYITDIKDQLKRFK